MTIDIHEERVEQAIEALERHAAFLNAAAADLMIDDPLEGLDQRWPEDFVNPNCFAERDGYQTQFDYNGTEYTLTITKTGHQKEINR